MLVQTEIMPDGTLMFVRGEQQGMIFRRYTDHEIKELLDENRIISFQYSAEGDRIVVCC
ncbi:hypothetical protein JXQ70_11285 [bacterium]|nr:hypothetical protein [bacterium]